MKDGVSQKVIFVGGHCLQYIVTRIHHVVRPKADRDKTGVHVENLK